MAERNGKGSQRPSRLRNEVRPESTDDERDRKKSAVQVPDSDAVVPDTHPDHDGNFNHHDPGPDNESEFALSPNSAALLERTAVAKRTEANVCIPFSIKLLTRDLTGLKDSSASASSNPFALSYFGARKFPSKTSPKEGATTAESFTHTGLTTPDTQKHEACVSHDATAVAESAYASLPLLPNNDHYNEPSVASNQDVEFLDQSVTRQPQTELGYILPIQADTTSDIAPSAQLDERSTSGTSNVRDVKKNKKGRRGQLHQQRERPRHPRSRITPRYDHQAGTNCGPAPETPTGPQRLCQMNDDGDVVHASHAHTGQGPAPIDGRHGHAYAQEFHLPKAEHAYIPFDEEPRNTTQSLLSTTCQDFQDPSAQRELPTSSVRIPWTLPPQINVAAPEQQPLATVQSQTDSFYPEEHAAYSTQGSGPCVLSNIQGLVDVPAVLTQSHQPEVHASDSQVKTQPKTVDAILPDVLKQDSPPRLARSRRKLRPSAPISHGLREKAMFLKVEQALKKVRVAILADEYLTRHEMTMITEQHKAEIAELQRTIDNQIQSVEEHDRSHQDLRKALSQLTDRAKTNQRFVTGLQQDREKLQKSATNVQKQSRKTSTEKITELEDEYQALQQEFSVMTDKLAATHRKMKSTFDDVYVRFIISESKRKDLAENLDKQNAALKEERRKRDEVEKQFLFSVQGIPRQILDSSDALTKKLELLQSSLDNFTAHDDRNGQIKECLDAFQTLRLMPALRMQDLEQMESTLRLVHERLDLGLDSVSETLKCKAPPDAELQKFIKEQLHGLQTDMLRYEEVTAENRKMHDLNASLKAQLEAQQQHSNRLDEHIKGFQQADIDLRARYGQLERDSNELRDVPYVDKSKLEQEVPSLRQQLKQAEEDLEAANTKVEKTARERDTHKGYYEDVKTQLLELQQNIVVEDSTAVREKIAKDCENKFAEKEHSFKSEIHRIAIDNDEKEKTLQELRNKLDAADAQLVELNEKIQTINLQAQAVQHQTTLQTMRQEADRKIAKVRQEAGNTLQLSHNQISTLQEEKGNLTFRLEQVQMNEGKLQHEAAELRAAKTTDEFRRQTDADQENQRLVEQHRTEIDDWERRVSQKDAALKQVEAKLRVAEDEHRIKITRDQEAAESNMLKLKQKYRDALRVAREQGSLNQQDDSQVQVAKKPFTESFEITQSAEPRNKVNRQNRSVLEVPQEQNRHSGKPPSTFHAEISQTQLEDDDLFATQFEEQGEIDETPHNANGIDPELGTATESQDPGNLSMTQDAFNHDLLQASQQVLKYQTSSSTEFSSISTDELTLLENSLPLPTGTSRGYNHRASNHGGHSYEFPQTLEDSQHNLPIVLRGYGRDHFNHGTALTDTDVVSVADNEFVAGSQSSLSSGRPKSQANTASRMMPPPSNSRYSRLDVGVHVADLGVSIRHAAYGKVNTKSGSSDSRHPKSSSSKQNYSQHDPRNCTQTESQYGSSQDMEQDHTEKRKSNIDQTERDTAIKKQCTQVQSSPLNSSTGLPSQSPFVSIASPKAQKTTSHTQGSASFLSRSKTPVLSSRVRGRISRQTPSSGDAYSTRGQSSSQVAATGPTRRSSTRLTWSQCRNGTAFGDGFNERFDEELDQRR